MGRSSGATVPVTSVFGRTGAVAAVAGDYEASEVTGSMVLVGSDTNEYTTTSLTAVDLVTISGLSIPVGQGVLVSGVYRKTAGAANFAGVGLKINDTVTGEAKSSGSGQQVATTTSANQAEAGIFEFNLMPRSAGYLHTGTGRTTCRVAASGANTSSSLSNTIFTQDAAIPNATITSITIRGISGNASVTLAVKDVFIYTYPVT